jgi:hypothetical protein
MRTCNACEFLNLTEGEQNLIKRQSGETKPHICNKYNKLVMHFPLPHPMIHPCEECIAESEE